MKNNNLNIRTPLIVLAFLTILLILVNKNSIFPRYGSARITSEMETWAFICLGVTVLVFILVNIKYFNKETTSTVSKHNLVTNTMKDEISEYLEILKGLGSEELGLAVLSALTFRKNFLKKNRIDLMDPLLALNQSPNIIINLSQIHEKVIEDNKPHLAVPLAVWIHTLRSIQNPVIRSIGREVWKELSRGFPHCKDKRESHHMIYGFMATNELIGKFPKGLEPMEIVHPKKEFKNKENELISKTGKENKLLEYKELYKKGLITKDALTKLQVELMSKD